MNKTKGEMKMNQSIRVRFTNSYNSSSSYDFLCNIEGIKSGDLVVVDTSNGYCCAEVTAIGISSARATKWVVSKVDLQPFFNRIADEKASIVKRNAIALLKKKMEARRAKIQDAEVYAQLAQSDDEMAELLKQLEALTNYDSRGN
jgi:hypothetical protein